MRIMFTDSRGHQVQGRVVGVGTIGTDRVLIINSDGRGYLVHSTSRTEFRRQVKREEVRV